MESTTSQIGGGEPSSMTPRVHFSSVRTRILPIITLRGTEPLCTIALTRPGVVGHLILTILTTLLVGWIINAPVTPPRTFNGMGRLKFLARLCLVRLFVKVRNLGEGFQEPEAREHSGTGRNLTRSVRTTAESWTQHTNYS